MIFYIDEFMLHLYSCAVFSEAILRRISLYPKFEEEEEVAQFVRRLSMAKPKTPKTPGGKPPGGRVRTVSRGDNITGKNKISKLKLKLHC